VSRPLEADYQALARGDSGCALRPYAPDASIREEIVVGGAGGLFSGATAVATLAERVSLRLTGRGRGAARVELTILGDRGERVVPLAATTALSSPDEIVELLAPQIGEAPGTVLRLRIVVVGEAIADAADLAAAVAASDDAPITALSSAIERRAGASGVPLADRRAGELAGSADCDGSLPWQLSAPSTLRAERRDAHRRTRRASKRRRTVAVAQSQLFGQLEHAEAANRW
jgi:hypothetical protein